MFCQGASRNSLRGPRLRWKGTHLTILNGIIATPEQPSIVFPAQGAGTPPPLVLAKALRLMPSFTPPTQLIETLTLCNTSSHWTIGVAAYSSPNFDKNHIFVPKWVHIWSLPPVGRGFPFLRDDHCTHISGLCVEDLGFRASMKYSHASSKGSSLAFASRRRSLSF